MITKIINPYIKQLEDTVTDGVHNTYVLLDCIMGITVRQFPNTEVNVREEDHMFQIKLDDDLFVHIMPQVTTRTVSVNAVSGGKDVWAFMTIGCEGVVREVYSPMNKDHRNIIREYFSKLGELNITEMNDPVEVTEEGEEVINA